MEKILKTIFVLLLASCSVAIEQPIPKISFKLVPPPAGQLFIGETFISVISVNTQSIGATVVSIIDLPKNATITDRGDGTAMFQWKPTRDQVGEYKLIVQAEDGHATETAVWQLEVVNRAPSAEGASIKIVNYYVTSTLTAKPNGLVDQDPGDRVEPHYQWFVNDIAVEEATGNQVSAPYFKKGDLVFVEVTPFDGRDSGESVRSNSVAILNTAPMADAVLDAGPHYADVDIGVNPIGWYDPDGATPSYYYSWRVNGTLVDGAVSSNLNEAHFAKNDTIQAVVTPYDDEATGPVIFSDTITIINKPPTFATLSIGAGPHTKASGLQSQVGGESDVDGDFMTFSYRWFVGGAPVAGQTAATLAGFFFSRDTTVFVEATIRDSETGTSHVSPFVTIGNSLPTLSNVAIDNGLYNKTSTLTTGVSGLADLDTGDSPTIRYTWYVNGISVPAETASSLAGVFVRADSVYVVATPHDGFAGGNSLQSSSVSIGNAVPVVNSASLGTGPYRKADTIQGFALGSDVDGDSVTFTYRWYVNGVYVALGGTFSGSFAKGDTVAAQVLPYDGFVTGTAYWTAPVIIQDTLPTVSNVSLGVGPFYKTSTLTASATKVDIDNDTVTLQYRWFVAGIQVTTQTTAQLSGLFSKGQTVAVEVTPQAASILGSSVWSNVITISNSAPVMTSVNLGAGPYYNDSSILAIVAASDDDGDLLGYSYRWFINSSLVIGQVGNSLTGGFVYGNSITVEAQPSDFQLVGAKLGSSGVLISNRAPGAPGVAIYPTTATANSLMIWSQVISPSVDPDGDATTYSYLWYRNSTLQAFPSSQTIVTSAEIAAGDFWQVRVTPSDGWASGNIATGAKYIYSLAANISAGDSHTCAITSGGGPKCWGLNTSGQLGNGDTTPQLTSVNVSGLTSGVQAVAAGSSHTCALTTAGGVKCWGGNTYGQLGDGSNTPHTTPNDVSGLTSGVQAVAAGDNFTCALTTAGGLKCWGYNPVGQLGNADSSTPFWTPIDVGTLTSGVQAITANGSHACALTTPGGGVKCWGYNYNGQIGNGNTTNQTAPIDVSGLTSGVIAIAAGASHTCALTTTGGVKCWGLNSSGQLGTGNGIQQPTPIDVSGLTSGVQEVVAGDSHTCALMIGGGLKCWGNNSANQISLGSTAAKLTAVDVTGLTSGVKHIAAGNVHTCALILGGGIQCLGSNTIGQLGNGNADTQVAPMDVSGLSSGVQSIVSGESHSCVITTPGGGMKCWGLNNHGQIGNGPASTGQITPIYVSGLTSGVQSAAAGNSHTCAVMISGGGLKCWGYNYNGQLGNGNTTQQLAPVDVGGMTSGVQTVTLGSGHTCALTTVGGLKCWGSRNNGRIGNGSSDNTNQLTPADVTGLTTGVQAIAAGGLHTCGLTAAGGVKCWGYNSDGQLGSGNISSQSTPVNVIGLTSGVQAIAAGTNHTCALTTLGGVKCWGNNTYAQLGNGAFTNELTPVDVSGLTSGVQAISASYAHTCALTTGGGVKCWGFNFSSQLGTWDTAQKLTPVDVIDLTSGVSAIAVGISHTCALTTEGGIKCLGGTAYGSLGYNGPLWVTGFISN